MLTSDMQVMPCSFHHTAIPFGDADDVMRIWRERQAELRLPARDPGCARGPGFGLARRGE